MTLNYFEVQAKPASARRLDISLVLRLRETLARGCGRCSVRCAVAGFCWMHSWWTTVSERSPQVLGTDGSE